MRRSLNRRLCCRVFLAQDGRRFMKAVPGQEPMDRDYHFVWAINLDETAADEYVVASGYSDGIDYSTYRAAGYRPPVILETGG